MSTLVSVKNVVKQFKTVKALNGVDLTLERGEQYAIKGSSGSGKSTLLYLLGGLDRATSGTVEVDGHDLAKMNDEALANYRNSFVGFVFQFHFLLPSMNCLDNILLPAKIGGSSVSKVKKECLELATLLGVDHCLKKFPFELSGGEQQRINIVRALSLHPPLLLCDEPTGNLDSENSEKVVALLKSSSAQVGSTLVMVTHDNQISSEFSNCLVMQDGHFLSSVP